MGFPSLPHSFLSFSQPFYPSPQHGESEQGEEGDSAGVGEDSRQGWVRTAGVAGAGHWNREVEAEQGGEGVQAGAKVGEEALCAGRRVAQNEVWGLGQVTGGFSCAGGHLAGVSEPSRVRRA